MGASFPDLYIMKLAEQHKLIKCGWGGFGASPSTNIITGNGSVVIAIELFVVQQRRLTLNWQLSPEVDLTALKDMVRWF